MHTGGNWTNGRNGEPGYVNAKNDASNSNQSISGRAELWPYSGVRL